MAMNRPALTAAALALSIAPAMAQNWRGTDHYRPDAGRHSRCQWEQVGVGTYTNSDMGNQSYYGNPRFDRNWNRCR
jgi:hypothetical protein